MPNIYDVARRARVSAATVSAVLNESAFVSPGLKARVQAAVASLGYEPNLLARGLAKRQTKTIGMIVPGFATDTVEMDDRGAAYEGVMHLRRLGYRRIGFIGGLHGASTSRRRLDGYRAALRDARLRFDPALVVEGDFRVESGYRAGLDLLKQRPDAVFIGNYLMTVGFMEALRQYRMRCPDDVAVVTCDDHPWLDAFSPRLTTIDLPKRELGAAAARLLVERIAHPRGQRRTVTLKTPLRVRQSCGCAP